MLPIGLGHLSHDTFSMNFTFNGYCVNFRFDGRLRIMSHTNLTHGKKDFKNLIVYCNFDLPLNLSQIKYIVKYIVSVICGFNPHKIFAIV